MSIPVTFIWDSPPPPANSNLTFEKRLDTYQKWLFSLKRWKDWICALVNNHDEIDCRCKTWSCSTFPSFVDNFLHSQDVIVKYFVHLWTHKFRTCWLNTRKVFYIVNKITYVLLFFSGCCTFSEVFSIWTFDCFSIKRQNCQTVGPKCVSNRYCELLSMSRETKPCY